MWIAWMLACAPKVLDPDPLPAPPPRPTVVITLGDDAAVTALRARLDADPDDLARRDAWIEALLAAGHADDARAAAEATLLRAPTHADAWSQLVRAYDALGQPDRADLCAARWTALAPDDPHRLVILGERDAGRGKHVAAEQAFRAAAQLDPADGAAWRDLGWSALAHGDDATAQRAFDALPAADREVALGRALAVRASDPRLAERRFDALLEAEPTWELAWFDAAVFHLRARDPAAATRVLDGWRAGGAAQADDRILALEDEVARLRDARRTRPTAPPRVEPARFDALAATVAALRADAAACPAAPQDEVTALAELAAQVIEQHDPAFLPDVEAFAADLRVELDAARAAAGCR